MTWASDGFAQMIPCAPSCICRRAIWGDLEALLCGRRPTPCSRRNDEIFVGVALELVEVEEQGGRVDLVLVAPDDGFLLGRQERLVAGEGLHERLR